MKTVSLVSSRYRHPYVLLNTRSISKQLCPKWPHTFGGTEVESNFQSHWEKSLQWDNQVGTEQGFHSLSGQEPSNGEIKHFATWHSPWHSIAGRDALKFQDASDTVLEMCIPLSQVRVNAALRLLRPGHKEERYIHLPWHCICLNLKLKTNTRLSSVFNHSIYSRPVSGPCNFWPEDFLSWTTPQINQQGLRNFLNITE